MVPIAAIKTEMRDQLPVAVYRDKEEMGRAAALQARGILQMAIAKKGEASLIIATGNSQLTFLHALRELGGIDWSKTNVFHMDEYLGIDPEHPASFPNFLERHFLRFVEGVSFHPLPSQPKNVEQACWEYKKLLLRHPPDLVACGWGENGHIAFNDPPYADFGDPMWIKAVRLSLASRRQQIGEGHFGSLEEVPTHAITLTVPALLSPKHILCIVPEARKARAVRACLEEPVSEDHPGSVLRRVAHAELYLDRDSAAEVWPQLG